MSKKAKIEDFKEQRELFLLKKTYSVFESGMTEKLIQFQSNIYEESSDSTIVERKNGEGFFVYF